MNGMPGNTKITERQFLNLIQALQPVSRHDLLMAMKARFKIRASGLRKNIFQAQAAGLVESIPDVQDGRKRAYRLTSEGEALLSSRFTKEMGASAWGFRQRYSQVDF